MNLLRSLGIVKVIRYKSRQWNQTNYYSLDRDRLKEYLKQQNAESIEISEMWSSTDRGEEYQTLEMRDSKVSYKGTKNTSKEVTAKQSQGDRSLSPELIAAASPKTALEEEKSQWSRNHHSARLTASTSQIKQESKQNKSNPESEQKATRVDYIVNKDWSKLISLLDSAGVPINRTIKDLLKLYPAEKVESAIALVRARKRESHIPNPSGYFVSALKGDWGSKNLVAIASASEEVDQVAVFRHWYDLARELGYCSGQEVREGEQWVCLSGSWEPWRAAVKRGYSLDYLKKIMKRSQGQ